MTFSLQIAGAEHPIPLSPGQTLFVVGANGTGKSSLLQRFAANVGAANAKRVSATRQTWFQATGLEFTPSQKTSYEQQARNWDTNTQSRYMESNPQIRAGLALYDLIDAENVDAREIAAAVRAGDLQKAEELALAAAPIAQINDLLAFSNIPVEISVEANDRLMASKLGSPPYPAAQLSDGERNALLIGAEVLTAKPGMLLIIDEPERHLHRSIISPLLSRLFRSREDCAFVVATHDLSLPLDNPEARVLLIRSCSYNGGSISGWDTDLLPPDADVSEELKRDIVGGRRRILFVEGEDSSLDRPLYSLLFPQVSVRARRTSREVQQAVEGLRASHALHWVQAFGIIDNDGRQASEIEALIGGGVYPLPFFSVESLYYHPEMIRRVAERQAEVSGADAETNTRAAIEGAIAAVLPHLGRLSARSVEKKVRGEVFAAIPTLREVEQHKEIALRVDTNSIVTTEAERLKDAANRHDWLTIVTRCPIRETPARDAVARSVGLPDRFHYEAAVLQLLRADKEAIAQVRDLFGSLPAELGLSA